MSTKVFLPKEVNVSNIKFGDVKPMNSNGGKILYLNYEGVNLNLQTPELNVPFDISEFKEADKTKYVITCALNNYNTNGDMKAFYEKLSEIDATIKKHAKENSMAFFKKAKISEETIDELYNPIVKFSIDKQTGEPNLRWPPNIKIKTQCKDGVFDCKMYDSKKTKFDLDGTTDNPSNINDLIVKGTRCKMLIQCTGIWIINGKFGCTWKVVQARLNVATKGLDEYAFRETGDDVEFVESDEEDEDNDEDEDEDEDDDDDDDDEEEEEVVEEVKKVEPKKKVRKAKTSN